MGAGHRSRLTAGVLVGLALAALTLAGATPGGAATPAVDGVPTLPPIVPAPTPTPTPTPTPAPPPPSSSPAPSQSGSPAPAPAAKPAPSNGGGSAPSSGSAAPGSSAPQNLPKVVAGAPEPSSVPPPSATPVPAAASGAQLVALGVISDAQLASQITAITQQPVTSERPSLRHFLPALAGSFQSPTASGLSGSTLIRSAARILAPILPLLAVLPGILVMWRRRRSSRAAKQRTLKRTTDMRAALNVVLRMRDRPALTRRARISALAAALVCAMVMVAGGVGGTSAAFQAAVRTAQPITPLPAHYALAPASAAPPRLSAWYRLLTIEKTLNVEQTTLIKQEKAVTNLTNQLVQVQKTIASQNGQYDASVAPNPVAAPAATLQNAVSLYQLHKQDYDTSLKQEYDLYVSIVQDPAELQAMTALAATQRPEVRAAVLFNLDQVNAQRQQEDLLKQAAALAAAQPASNAAPPVPTPTPEARSATEPVRSVSSNANKPGGASVSRSKHKLLAPQSGSVTQPFGPTSYSFEPPVSISGVFYPHFHTGLDIAAPLDNPIRSADDGTVIVVTSSLSPEGQLIGYGNWIAISHGNGLVTVYGHLDQDRKSVV